MNNITYILLNKDNIINTNDKFIYYEEATFLEDLKKIDTQYITFIKDYKNLTNNYHDVINRTIQNDFDSCFINYTIQIDNKIKGTEQIEKYNIKIKPYLGDYIWSYILKTEKLIELINIEIPNNNDVDNIFKNITGITTPLYHHVPNKRIINNFIYTDEKEEFRRKNIFYLGNYCNGTFNGYISWLNNIGKCFGNKYHITILYDKIKDTTKKRFEKYFEVIERNNNINYISDRLFVTYSTYYYPKNILHTEENYLFIHGNMSEFENSRKYEFDNYTKYIGVSKTCAEKAQGYFPTSQIEFVLNPIKIDPEEIYPHLKLVSAQRFDPIKRPDRIHKISKILDRLNIPYTWNVFTDKKPYDNEVYGGVIYRKSVINPIPYINDADYYVQLSDSEAFCYSVAEALYLNTKVVVTPLECFKELNVDETQGIIIPFEYFEDENENKLTEIVIKMYKDVHKQINNKLDKSMYEKYNILLKQ